jgi:hypothetical protein
MGYLRAAVGVGLIVAPRAIARSSSDPAPSGTAVLLMRTIGVRDLVLGAGTVAAANAGDGQAQGWLSATLASDALDVVVGLASKRLVGASGARTATLLPVPFVVGDLWVAGRLRAG